MNESQQLKRDIIADLTNSGSRVAAFLAQKQLPDGDYPARNFYGKAYSALLWGLCAENYDRNIENALTNMRRETVAGLPKNYHFEFNRFAIYKLRQTTNHNSYCYPELKQFKGTRVANWMLLRVNCRYLSGGILDRIIARIELSIVKKYFTKASGLIEDQRGAYTMQYHAFCAALLGELLNGPLKGSAGISRWFERSLNSFYSFILPGGQCNYLGRGSLQSFGYASAILALSHGYSLLGNIDYLIKLRSILDYVLRHQRDDGSLPLVLSGVEEGSPENFSLADPAYAGWWSYNNYYDYLPFTGALLLLSCKVLEKARGTSETTVPPKLNGVGRGQTIRKVEKGNYTAVVSLPNRKLWAASMPVPYISHATDYPLPCYGGEQQQRSLYSARGLPLPIVVTKQGQVGFSGARYNWCKPLELSFLGVTGGIKHRRDFEYNADSINMLDTLEWSNGVEIKHVFLPRILLAKTRVREVIDNRIVLKGLVIEFDAAVSWDDEDYCSPNGVLMSYYVKIIPSAGNRVTSSVNIKFAP
ncbi:MAG TPA: hypothetical protein VIM41_12290 [Gammaproteobacteria bacterium]